MYEAGLNLEAFLACLNVGDRFWFIDSWHGWPDRIIGPVVISGLRRAAHPEVDVVSIDSGTLSTHFIEDLTCPENGVYLSEVSATLSFERKVRMSETEPGMVLQRRIAKGRYEAGLGWRFVSTTPFPRV